MIEMLFFYGAVACGGMIPRHRGLGSGTPMAPSFMSGPPVPDNFTRGWALKFFGRGLAHYWRRHPRGNSGVTLCRPATIVPLRIWNGQAGLLEPGNCPRCRQCERQLARGGS
jgi:hypothetical protein